MTTLAERPSSPLALIRARGPVRGVLPLLGPAFIAAIAYVDPGNFATNFSGGSRYGYLLLWVVVVANLMAMLVQDLSAKLGLATGSNLPELCRRHFPRGVAVGLWAQAELVAMATDVAEVTGGAVALNLLFGLPLVVGGLVTGAVAFLLLGLQRKGFRRLELVIAGLLGVILLGFLVNLFRVHIGAHAAAAGLVPHFAGSDSVVLATGILGATVMPHAVYLHSALTQNRVAARDGAEKRTLLRFQRLDVITAMTVAGAVNIAMLVTAAAVFSGRPVADDGSLAGIHTGLSVGLGRAAGLTFAVALLVSGFASSGVGTLAGQVIMSGFLRRSVPQAVRRLVTLAPAVILLAAGADATHTLVLSQVVLSFGLPFALVPLLLLTRRRSVMGELVNTRVASALAALVVTVIVGLNGFLVVETLG